MELILWRHADAEPGVPDLERKLTKKGVKQAEKMAAWLKERLTRDFIILASPAERARQTAAALDADYRVAAEIAPGADAATILAACGWPGGKGTVVVVGHQPALGQVASFLLSGASADWTIKKGALWWIEGRERGDAAQTVLRAVMAPDFL